ncbi:MAG: helix-turn-helix domain-containing protein, partial [Clostridia bacterium]|nr:helix-turn-helix domain-containing protein [Clostridia bacterium]
MKYEIKYRLKELRVEKGYTQKQLAQILNKSETAYASWEQGLSEPSVNDIRKLCKIFEVSTDYLLGIESLHTINVTGLNEHDI